VRSAPRGAGPLRVAFTRAVQDWWYGLIPFAVLNLLWLLMVVTVVAGPPATAAMLGVARDAASGEGAEPVNFFRYVRQYFKRGWLMGLVTLLGTIILVTDLRFYADLMSGNPGLLNAGMWIIVYVFLVWFEFLLIAWPISVNHPEMAIRDVLRNAAILTLRLPGANLGLALMVLFLSAIALSLAVLVSLVLAALVSLIAQHYLYVQAPVLANFPPAPGRSAHGPAAPDLKE
jgi:uncharacterized membrane protein YesL